MWDGGRIEIHHEIGNAFSLQNDSENGSTMDGDSPTLLNSLMACKMIEHQQPMIKMGWNICENIKYCYLRGGGLPSVSLWAGSGAKSGSQLPYQHQEDIFSLESLYCN